MIGLPFITDLFTNVLSKSKGIEGRFAYCPNMGKEINTEDLDAVIKDQFAKAKGKKYPCVIMMPPTSTASFIQPMNEWESYQVMLFFLTTTYNSATNQLKDPNPNTQTSTHTIMQDQHDMGRCARNFITVLDKVVRKTGTVRHKLQVDNTVDKTIRPIGTIGVDKACGVRLDFRVKVAAGCTVEDYDDVDIDAIVIPEKDSHPIHQL